MVSLRYSVLPCHIEGGKKMRKQILIATMIAGILCSGCGSSGGSGTSENAISEGGNGTTQYTMTTGGSGAAYFMFGAAMASAVNNSNLGFEISSQAGNGTTENINLVYKGESDLGFGTLDVVADAYAGKGDYEETGAYENLRLVLLGHTGANTYVVWDDSKYQSFEDLEGATFGVGPGTSAFNLAAMALTPWGLELPDEAITVGYGDMSQSMKDGSIDVAIFQLPTPSSNITDMISTKRIRILSQTEESMAKILDDAGNGLVRVEIPANTYEGVDYDVLTFGNLNCIFASVDMSEEDVYKLVKTIWNTDLTSVYPYGNEWASENVYYGTDFGIPYHPGAEKFLKEVGAIE
ncbi:MAG: TAXI family TRAP transporter solute-binding subunit [Clostridiales bacterium]|nr:TAXI family TRAP transporter solute-binding subunit [Clostridiales bacterium]